MSSLFSSPTPTLSSRGATGNTLRVSKNELCRRNSFRHTFVKVYLSVLLWRHWFVVHHLWIGWILSIALMGARVRGGDRRGFEPTTMAYRDDPLNWAAWPGLGTHSNNFTNTISQTRKQFLPLKNFIFYKEYPLLGVKIYLVKYKISFFQSYKRYTIKKNIKPPSVHILAQKRAELSALTQEGGQSAKGCSERGCPHPAPQHWSEGSPGPGRDLPSGFSGQRVAAPTRAGTLTSLLLSAEKSPWAAGGDSPFHTGGVLESQDSVHRDSLHSNLSVLVLISRHIDQF